MFIQRTSGELLLTMLMIRSIRRITCLDGLVSRISRMASIPWHETR